MQYLEHHDDIWHVVKWTLGISIPLAVTGLAIYTGLRLKHEKAGRALENAEAEVRAKVHDILLGKIVAAKDANNDGKIDFRDALIEIYAKTASEYHHVIDEVAATLGVGK